MALGAINASVAMPSRETLVGVIVVVGRPSTISRRTSMVNQRRGGIRESGRDIGIMWRYQRWRRSAAM